MGCLGGVEGGWTTGEGVRGVGGSCEEVARRARADEGAGARGGAAAAATAVRAVCVCVCVTRGCVGRPPGTLTAE